MVVMIRKKRLEGKIENEKEEEERDKEEKETCQKCRKRVRTSGVCCGKCKYWGHYKCEKIKHQEVKELGEKEYMCRECEPREEDKQEMEELKRELESKTQRIDKLISDKVISTSRLKELKQKMNQLEETTKI